jgi:hypothetical protein
MENQTSDKPIALLVDDSVYEMYPFVMEMLNDQISEDFEVVLIGDTDQAVEFTLANSNRIFMFVQDSRRPEGKVIPAWKKLRPMPGPTIGYRSHQGDFYTYLIDAYSPVAGVVFSGFSFSKVEEQLITEWGMRDPRIVLVNKWDFISPRMHDKEKAGFITVGLHQLERWRKARMGNELSHSGKIVVHLAEELVALCGARPQQLDNLSSRQFEEVIASIFRNHGFSVELTSRTRDGGYDIVAAAHTDLISEVSLIEVKHFAPNRPVGVGIVRALYGVKHLHQVSKVLLVTSSYISPDAKREFSRVIPWELEFVERSKVIDWCKSYLSELLDITETNNKETSITPGS